MFETWEETAIREVKEEMDLDLDRPKFAHVTNDIMAAEEKHYVTIFMMAECESKDAVPKNMEPDKCLGWNSYTWPELKEIYNKGEPKLFGPLQRLLEDEPEAAMTFVSKS
jgi:8-oxo-dGTP diphosphatase